MKFFFMLYLLFFTCLSHAKSDHPFTSLLYELSEEKKPTTWYDIDTYQGLRTINVKIPYKYIKNSNDFKSPKEYQDFKSSKEYQDFKSSEEYPLANLIARHKNQIKPQVLDHSTEIRRATLIRGEMLTILFCQVAMKVPNKKNN